MSELAAVLKRERDYEVTNCMHDSSYFIGKFLRVQGDSPVGVMLDTPKEELVEIMENEPLVIGRYPRRYGKTTTLVGFAIHKALFEQKTVLYGAVNMARRLDFLRDVSYSYKNLPDWMQKPHSEGPNGFQIGLGKILPIPVGDAYGIEGRRFDYMILDDIGEQTNFRVDRFVNAARANNAVLAIVGTFKPDNPILGVIWSEARKRKTGWASLPSFNEEWKVQTILSLSDRRYSVDY